VPSNYSSSTNVNFTNAVFTITSPTTVITNPLMRDRVRAIVQLLVTSAEYAIQK
jgi:hypothetical protein